jgi:hypothetical protein
MLAVMVSRALPEISSTRWRNLFTQQVSHARFDKLIERVRTRYVIDSMLQSISSSTATRGEDGCTCGAA